MTPEYVQPSEPIPRGPAPSPQAVTVFVLGILGITCCNILAPIALILGLSERKLVSEGVCAPSGLLTAGWIMGIVGTVLLCLNVLCTVLWFLIVFLGLLSGVA